MGGANELWYTIPYQLGTTPYQQHINGMYSQICQKQKHEEGKNKKQTLKEWKR